MDSKIDYNETLECPIIQDPLEMVKKLNTSVDKLIQQQREMLASIAQMAIQIANLSKLVDQLQDNTCADYAIPALED
jgi:hypothetical protein